MSALGELEAAARTVVERIGSAVVSIGRDGRGSGIVIAPGQVLTNAHNLRDRTTSVTFADGRAEQGSAVGVDADGDLAVVTVDTGAATPIEWGDPTTLGVGSIVFAASRGTNGVRIAFGMVSGAEGAFRGPRGRRITGTLEHSAPLSRGSSGGPAVDTEGRLVGLNTNRLGDGFYAALPADADLRARVEALASGTSPSRPRLGVAVAPSAVAHRLRRSVGLPERDGVLVRGVDAGGAGARAGVEVGDLLVSAGGRQLREPDDLSEALDALEGDALELVVVRGAEERTVQVSFAAETPEEAEGAV